MKAESKTAREQGKETVCEIFEERGASQLVDIDTLCAPLNCTHRTILNYIHAGRLNAVKVGAKWKVNAEEVERFLAATLNNTPKYEEKPAREKGRPRKKAEALSEKEYTLLELIAYYNFIIDNYEGKESRFGKIDATEEQYQEAKAQLERQYKDYEELKAQQRRKRQKKEALEASRTGTENSN